MKTMLAIAMAAMISNTADATSYLCVPEAAAVVTHTSKGVITSAVLTSKKKWLLSDESGTWGVKALGDKITLFDRCKTEFYCDRAGDFSGIFSRDPTSGVFTVIWIGVLRDETRLISEKGKCSKIA